MAHQLCFSFPHLFFSLELLAFPSVALGSSLAVTFSFTSRKLSSPGRAQNESLHPGVLMWEWKHSITEVLSTLVIADVHPKAQSSPEVLSTGQQSLAFSFVRC